LREKEKFPAGNSKKLYVDDKGCRPSSWVEKRCKGKSGGRVDLWKTLRGRAGEKETARGLREKGGNARKRFNFDLATNHQSRGHLGLE